MSRRVFELSLALLVVCLVVAAAWPRVGRRLGGAIASIVTLQAAVVVAAYNGLRGRWNVWHR